MSLSSLDIFKMEETIDWTIERQRYHMPGTGYVMLCYLLIDCVR